MKNLFIIAVLLLTACAEERFDHNPKFTNRSFVVLKKPGTQDYKECGVSTKDPLTMYEAVEKCRKDAEAAGYKLVSEY